MSTLPSDRLRAARIARGFESAAEAARSFGWSEVTYTSHENGIRGIRKDVAERYGKAFCVDPATLLGFNTSTHFDAVHGVHVIGSASWGLWRDTRMSTALSPAVVDVPRQPNATDRRAVIVSDDSVNKVMASGTFAIFEPVPDLRALTTGKFVVIRRTRGDLEELSVRRVLSAVDDVVRLSAYSTNVAYTETLTFNVNTLTNVEVVGIVVGKYSAL